MSSRSYLILCAILLISPAFAVEKSASNHVNERIDRPDGSILSTHNELILIEFQPINNEEMDLQELITSLQGEESPDVTLKLGLTIIFSGGDKDLSEKTIERAKMLNPDYKPICDKISGILTSLGPLSPNQSKKAIDQVLKASNSEELMMEMEMVIRGGA